MGERDGTSSNRTSEITSIETHQKTQEQQKYNITIYIIRHDTRCYFKVRSKADISQLNLPHGNRQLKSVKTEKLKSRPKKTDMLRSKVNSL